MDLLHREHMDLLHREHMDLLHREHMDLLHREHMDLAHHTVLAPYERKGAHSEHYWAARRLRLSGHSLMSAHHTLQ
jgi:hypothetical protein